MDVSGWFGVRTVADLGAADHGGRLFEERVTIWRADRVDDAIASAEAEADEYARAVDGRHLGLARSFTLADELEHGAEVFSLIRSSELAPRDYLDSFFDTGTERQQRG